VITSPLKNKIAADEHGDIPAPAGKSLGSVVGTMLFRSLFEFQTGNELRQLGEAAGKSLHGRASLTRIIHEGSLRYRTDQIPKICFGQE
jgi:hypothetical protein